MTAGRVEQPRYFWTGWFDGQSFMQLAAVFCLLSFVDLQATLCLMATGRIGEANLLADFVLKHYHTPGFIVLKALMVFIVLLCTWVVQRANTQASRLVLWAGCLIMGVVALRHLAIFLRLILQTNGWLGY